jgi:hypothetical protein
MPPDVVIAPAGAVPDFITTALVGSVVANVSIAPSLTLPAVIAASPAVIVAPPEVTVKPLAAVRSVADT